MLNQEEIDKLIAMLGEGQNSSETDGEEQTERRSGLSDKAKIRVYDFRRPDKFSKEQLRTVQMIHDTFARQLTGLLSGKLRAMVQVTVSSVDQMTYQEFMNGLSNPGIIALVTLKPLTGNMVLEISPSLGFPMIDRLFGGPGQEVPVIRAITDIEQTVLERIIVSMLDIYKEVWRNIVEITPNLESMQINPLFAQVIAPNEMVLVVVLKASFGDFSGEINLCIPYMGIESFLPSLSSHRWFARPDKKKSADDNDVPERRLDEVAVDIAVELGKAEVLVNQILDMNVGDVIVLDTKIDGEVRVRVSNKLKFMAKAGRIKSRFAVRLTRLYEEEGVNKK